MVLRLYDFLLDQDLTRLDPARVVAMAADLATKKTLIEAAFGHGEIATRALVETRAKHVDGPALLARLTRLQAIWPDLRTRLGAHLMTAPRMRAALHAAGAPSDAEDIGVTRDYLRQTTLNARFLRSRYTVLDLLDETGLLHAAVEAALPVQPTAKLG